MYGFNLDDIDQTNVQKYRETPPARPTTIPPPPSGTSQKGTRRVHGIAVDDGHLPFFFFILKGRYYFWRHKEGAVHRSLRREPGKVRRQLKLNVTLLIIKPGIRSLPPIAWQPPWVHTFSRPPHLSTKLTYL